MVRRRRGTARAATAKHVAMASAYSTIGGAAIWWPVSGVVQRAKLATNGSRPTTQKTTTAIAIVFAIETTAAAMARIQSAVRGRLCRATGRASTPATIESAAGAGRATRSSGRGPGLVGLEEQLLELVGVGVGERCDEALEVGAAVVAGVEQGADLVAGDRGLGA